MQEVVGAAHVLLKAAEDYKAKRDANAQTYRELTTALERLNEAQREFECAVAQMKKSFPVEWG